MALTEEQLSEIEYLQRSSNKYGYYRVEKVPKGFHSVQITNGVKLCAAIRETPEEAAWEYHVDSRFVKPALYDVEFPSEIPSHMDRELLLKNFSKSLANGFRGVAWRAATKKFVASYTLDYKSQYIGSYDTPLEAGWAYIVHSQSEGHKNSADSLRIADELRRAKPPIELDKIAYLIDDRTNCGYRYVERWSTTLYYARYNKHSTYRYDTPAEAAWALHCELGKVRIKAIKQFGDIVTDRVTRRIAKQRLAEYFAVPV